MPSTKKTDLSVLMVAQSLPPQPSGGAELQALRLAHAMQQKGVAVLFVCPGVAGCKGFSTVDNIRVWRLYSVLNYLLDLLFFIQKVSPPPRTVIEYDDKSARHDAITRKIGWGARLRYNIFLVNAYFFLKKRSKTIDIIHSHTLEWPGYVCARLSRRYRKKLVLKDSTMNGITNILRFPEGRQKQQLMIGHGNFVAMTWAIRASLEKEGVLREKISDIPNGIEPGGDFKTDYTSSSQVLFVGNLYQQPAKGVDILLKAWITVAATTSNCTLLLAGDGNIKDYEAYASSLGIADRVRFLGKHNDIASLMLEADVFVLPSRREGMPNVLMEAMLKGLPCVATDISGSQDLIRSGENGLLVPVSDVEALAKGIISIMQNRPIAERLGRNARATILQSFRIEDVAEQYIALYRRLTEKTSAS